MTRLPAHDGGTLDLTHYRAGDRREDFVALVEAEHGGPGWTALARTAEDDLVLVLKNPADSRLLQCSGFPMADATTRHGTGGISACWVLKTGRAVAGHAASAGDNALKRQGVPTTFRLHPDRTVSFRHVLGARGLGNGATPPLRVSTELSRLVLHFADGKDIATPFDGAFLV